MKNILFCLCVVAVSVVGCSNKKEPTVVINDKLPLSIPSQGPLKLEPVKFMVVTPTTSGAAFYTLKKNKRDEVLFSLTVDDYRNLATNIQAIKNYIIIQNETIKAYKNYYNDNKNKDTK